MTAIERMSVNELNDGNICTKCKNAQERYKKANRQEKSKLPDEMGSTNKLSEKLENEAS